MKIEIEITDNDKATLTIDGRKMTIEKSRNGCVTALEGVEVKESTNTLGGIIAGQIYSKIGDIMGAKERAGAVATWEIVNTVAAQVIEDALF